MECLKSTSTVLPEIGLALLKFVSSHRGLTYVCQPPCLVKLTIYSPEIFDEYTRRQYVAKAPERNPFGVEEEPAKFTEFDTFTKVGPHTQHRSSRLTTILSDPSIATAYTMGYGESGPHSRENGGTKG